MGVDDVLFWTCKMFYFFNSIHSDSFCFFGLLVTLSISSNTFYAIFCYFFFSYNFLFFPWVFIALLILCLSTVRSSVIDVSPSFLIKPLISKLLITAFQLAAAFLGELSWRSGGGGRRERRWLWDGELEGERGRFGGQLWSVVLWAKITFTFQLILYNFTIYKCSFKSVYK